jgi:hypothetical protein
MMLHGVKQLEGLAIQYGATAVVDACMRALCIPASLVTTESEAAAIQALLLREGKIA